MDFSQREPREKEDCPMNEAVHRCDIVSYRKKFDFGTADEKLLFISELKQQ